MSTRNSDSFSQERSPVRSAVESVRKITALLARSTGKLGGSIASPVRSLFARTSRVAEKSVQGEDRAGEDEAADAGDGEQSVLRMDRREFEQGLDQESKRQPNFDIPERQEKRRLTIIPQLPAGLPPRESDAYQRYMPNNQNGLRDSPCISKAVEKGWFKEAAQEIFLDCTITADNVFAGVEKQARTWLDREVMTAYHKQRTKEVPKDTCFRASNNKEPLYKFFENVARNDPAAGFLLENIRPVCITTEQHMIAIAIREACTPSWHEELCYNLFVSLEKRMPKDSHVFKQARSETFSSDQLQRVTTELVQKYTITDETLARQKKQALLDRLYRPLERRGLDNRLYEIDKADTELRECGQSISDEETFGILMTAMRAVPASDPKRCMYQQLEMQLRRTVFSSSTELVQEIRLFEQSYMSDNVKDEHALLCQHCQKKGHDAKQCWILHPELKDTQGSKQGGGRSFGGTCHNCGKQGHKRYMCPEPRQQQAGGQGNDKQGNSSQGHPGDKSSKPESAMLMQHEACFQLDGAISADKVTTHGTYKLCATKMVPGQRCASLCMPQVDADSEEEEGDSEATSTQDGAPQTTVKQDSQATQRDGNNTTCDLDLSLFSNEGDEALQTAVVASTSAMLHAIQSDIVDKDGFDLTHVQDQTLLLLSAPGGETRAIIDNACTHGVTNRLDLLTNIRKRLVSFKGVGTGSAQYVGDAAFKVRTDSGALLMVPSGVTMAYMPDFNNTILSFHHLVERGWRPNILAGTMQAGKHRVPLINESRLDYVAIIPAGDGAEEQLLLLENAQCVLRTENVALQDASCYLMAQDSGMHYHALLGHFGKRATINTLKKISDIQIGDMRGMDFDQFCHACTAGKMKNAPTGCGRIHMVDKAKYPGQIVSLDFQGPFAKTPSGLKYTMTGIDHMSSYGWAIPAKHKDDAYEDVDKLLKDLRARSGYSGTVLVLTDNEPLWTCAEMAEVLKTNNAIRRGSIEYEHRSNGRCERFNQTLQQTARCAFAQSGAPPQLWPVVMQYSCEIYNRIVQKDGKAPIEKFCNGEIRGADLGVFGCLAYGYEPAEHREKKNKLAPRYLVGMNAGPSRAFGKSNGVAILGQTKRGDFKLTHVSAAVFDTNVFPFKHGLQEVLTTRQYQPILHALKGTAELKLEYERGEEDGEGQADVRVVQADKHELLGSKVRMVVKGRTRFGTSEWFGEIKDIIKDKSEPENDTKTKCRIFFEPDSDHPEGAWQDVPLEHARDMVVPTEIAALIMECMDDKLYNEQVSPV